MSRDLLGVTNGLENALTERDGNVVRVERALCGKQPAAALILLANNDRLVGRSVEVFADLRLDQRTLLLDDDDKLQPLREILQVLVVQWPGATDLEQPYAELVGAPLTDAEIVERLAHIEIALAGGDNAHLGVAATGEDDAVESVDANEGRCGRRA